MEENPWKDLEPSKGLYISSKDEASIEKLQTRLGGKKEYELHLDLLPEPFIGNPSAPIYLLNLNPGYNKKNEAEMPIIRDYIIKNNKHDKSMEYPFYYLITEKFDPKVAAIKGSEWWQSKLSQLKKEVGDQQKLSKNIFCIEYFPYHSMKYKDCKEIGKLPSQKYVRYLIEKAINNEKNNENKIFIIMRSLKKWLGLEELRSGLYKLQKSNRIFFCSNYQNPAISFNNLKELKLSLADIESSSTKDIYKNDKNKKIKEGRYLEIIKMIK